MNIRHAFLIFAAGISLSAHAAVTKTELAGSPLDEYPWFEYVRDYNTLMHVRIAIDPTRFPGIVGKTCDIYVVDHKTAGAWAADPSLVDVTPGGAQPHTFVAGTIQANTVSVVPNLTLSDDAGSNLGKGYDVVLDCNHNGVLDADDYVDGNGKEAGFYEVADTTRPGPFLVNTTSYNLPSAIATAYGIPAMFRAETVWYPRNIATIQRKLPLVVISHGNGYLPAHYGYIGRHLASWGYVVMAHSTDTEPGPLTAAATTLEHTDAFLDAAAAGTIVGGALAGRIESHRIAWLGHSRGGEGVVIAYHNLFTSTVTPAHFSKTDIKLVDSMAPTDIWWTSAGGGIGISHPHDANFHLWLAAGDTDVWGDPADPRWQSQPIADRATSYKQVSVIHGMGHPQFSDASTPPFIDGPCQLATADAHAMLLGYLLPLVKRYLDGNVPSIDFLTRQYEFFHPRGIGLENPCIVMANEYRSGAVTGNFVIDDFQWNLAPEISSAPGGVTWTVDNYTEGRLDDNNGSYNYTASDPFNGAIFGVAPDITRGVTFDWTGDDRYVEWQVPKTGRDFRKYAQLSFRAAQASRHPNTIAALEDLRFAVELRDVHDHTSTININAYGAGLQEPYQRSGGWYDEMETVRLRNTDFLNNGSGLDLANIVAVKLKFGPTWGSSEGRIVLDDLMLTNDF